MNELILGGAIVVGVLAFVVWPIVARGNTSSAGARASIDDDEHIERRIAEYREALRRGTVCERCLHANVDGARYCAECGTRLPAGARDAA